MTSYNQNNIVYVRKDRKHLSDKSQDFLPAYEENYNILEDNGKVTKYYRKKSYDVAEFFSEHNDHSTECHSDGQHSDSNLSDCGDCENHRRPSFIKLYVKKTPTVKIESTRDIRGGQVVEIVPKETFNGYEVLEQDGDVIKYYRPKEERANEFVF